MVLCRSPLKHCFFQESSYRKYYKEGLHVYEESPWFEIRNSLRENRHRPSVLRINVLRRDAIAVIVVSSSGYPASISRTLACRPILRNKKFAPGNTEPFLILKKAGLKR